MTEKIIIEKLEAGYRLLAYPHRSLVLSAQDMRDLFDYCLLHMAEIEAEAKHYEQQQKGESQPHVRSYEEIETEIQELRAQEEEKEP